MRQRRYKREMDITPLGDSALIVQVSDNYESDPDKTAHAVLDTLRRLESAEIPGVIELAPAYATVAVFFDPLRAIDAGAPAHGILPWVEERIRQGLEYGRARKGKPSSMRTIEIPVCYDVEFALDLDEVAQHTKRTPDDVVLLHSSGKYRVACLGFTPGFPFLSGLNPELATPRRERPRKEVPAGSVAIGGRQTGIYPSRSPGGWNVIGRTPLAIFDFKRESPALLQLGDSVQFRAVTRQEFEMLWQEHG
jgi:inhibitor of KinA